MSSSRLFRNDGPLRPNCGVVEDQATRLVYYSVDSGELLMILENNIS